MNKNIEFPELTANEIAVIQRSTYLTKVVHCSEENWKVINNHQPRKMKGNRKYDSFHMHMIGLRDISIEAQS